MKFGFTEYFIIAVVLLVIIVDVILYLRGGSPDTISDKFAFWSMRYPIIAVLVGIIIGHLAWPNLEYCP